MSVPPPPPPRRARGPVDPAPTGPPPEGGVPTPPPRRRTPTPQGPAPSPEPQGTPGPAAGATRTNPTAPRGGPTRAERQAAAAAAAAEPQRRGNGNGNDGGGGRRRWLMIGAIVVVVLLIGGGAFALLSGGGGGGDTAEPPKASTNVELEPGAITVEWPGFGPSPIAEGASDQVMSAIGLYIDQGVVPALRGKKVDPADLSGAFDEAAIARISATDTQDRAALFDEGVPEAIGKLTITAANVPMTALNDGQNSTLLVNADLVLNIEGINKQGKFTITRLGELVFAPDTSGAWKITGWSILVDRQGAGFPTTTTADDPTASTTSTTPVETP